MFLGFFIIKRTRCTNFPNLLQHETLHVSGSSSAHYQEFIHCTLGTGICHTGLKRAFEQNRPGPARKLSTKPIRNIPMPTVQWINSWWQEEELPETCRVSCRSKFEKLVHLVGFIIKKFVTMHGHMNVKFMFLGYVVFQLFCIYNYWQCNNVISQVESFALLLLCYVIISYVYYIIIVIIIYDQRKLECRLLGWNWC